MARLKMCRGCERWLPLGSFYRKQGRGSGVAGYYSKCKECERARRVARHAADPSQRSRYGALRYRRHKARLAEANRAWRWRKRTEVIEFLGGKCAMCGFADIRALQVDHVNGGGTRERKSDRTLGVNDQLKRVRAHPTLFQCLCANCNWI